MPVKVRCSGCEKVLNAPDKARGKVVRCPQCETPIRVPSASKKKSAKAAPKSDSDFLANLDLGQAEDTSVKLCPSCGAEVYPDDLECPSCEADLSGDSRPGSRAGKKKKRRGPDPARFYGEAWSGAWQFLGENKGLLVRTAIYAVVMNLLINCFLFMTLWVHRIPPKVFWGFLLFASSLVVPGWIWHLFIATIQGTLEKKKKLKRVNFDLFGNMALGLKVIFWQIAFVGPSALLGGLIGGALFLATGSVIPALAMTGLGALIGYLMAPIAMSHMSVLVTTRGWLSFKVFPVFLKHIVPCLYIFALNVLMLIPLAGASTGASLVWQNDVSKFYGGVIRNTFIAQAQEAQTAAQGKNRQLRPEIQRLAAEEPAKLDFMPMIAPVCVGAIAQALICLPVVFMARVYGTFTLFFKRDLDLVTMKKEKKYVRKEDASLEGGTAPGEASWVTMILAPVALAMIGMAIVAPYQYMRLENFSLLHALGTGMMMGAAVTAVIGWAWIVYMAFEDSPMWGMGIIVLGGLGIGEIVWIVFVILNWRTANKPFVLHLISSVFVGIGWGMMVAGVVADAVQ